MWSGESPTSFKSSATLSVRSFGVFPIPWMRRGSAIMSPTVIRGFNELKGSWKMICIRRRKGLSFSRGSSVMSCPSKKILPPWAQSAGGACAPPWSSRSPTPPQAQAPPPPDGEGHPVHRLHARHHPGKHPAPDGEVLLQVPHLHEDAVRAHAPTPLRISRQRTHLTRRPSPPPPRAAPPGRTPST